MSDDEVDPELLELLRQSLGLSGPAQTGPSPNTRVLESAQHIFDNAIDVAIDPADTRTAAATVYEFLQKKKYGTKAWGAHELHPRPRGRDGHDRATADFVFTMDLLNFSFWSDEREMEKQFAIEYHGRRWKGYWSLVAALRRALDEDIPITTPSFWADEDQCPDSILQHVFRSAADEPIPLLTERIACLREAGKILCDDWSGSFCTLIEDAKGSAGYLVNLIAETFPCFADRLRFEGREVHIYKRAQILVADIWACFRGRGYGEFHDVDKITMFADYRIPQILHSLGCLRYSPPLESHIRSLRPIPSGSRWEVELRGTSIWAVEMIRRQIVKDHPETAGTELIRTIRGSGDNETKNGNDQKQDHKEKYSEEKGEENGGKEQGIGEQDSRNRIQSAEKQTQSAKNVPKEGKIRFADEHGPDDKEQHDAEIFQEGSVHQADPEIDESKKTTDSKQDFDDDDDDDDDEITGINTILIDFLLYDTMKEWQALGLEEIPHHRTRSIWY